MKDQLISFETAKLAKEVGFGTIGAYILLHTYYDKKGSLTDTPHIWKRDPSTSPYGILQLSSVEVGVSQGMDNSLDEFILAPTQSLLQKWIREEYSIYLAVEFVFSSSYTRFNCRLDRKARSTTWNEDLSNTYEEALEVGLVNALEVIKNKKNNFNIKTTKHKR